MDRRTFLAGTGAVILAAPLVAEAQTAGKVPRVGLLDYADFWDPLRQGLSESGYVDGKTIVFEYRMSQAQNERLPSLARELVQRRVDVIVTYGTPATQAAKQATTTIPIVMVGVGDPVKTGLVASPGVSHVAFLWNPQNASNRVQLENVLVRARALELTLLPVQASGPDDLDSAFAAMMKKRPDALMITADPLQQLFVGRIVQLAATHQLPAIYQVKQNVIVGGLMSYGPSLAELFRRAAPYVDKILKGAKPADLPVEQPTRFELVINLKTAKALGLTIPQSLLGRADEVIACPEKADASRGC